MQRFMIALLMLSLATTACSLGSGTSSEDDTVPVTDVAQATNGSGTTPPASPSATPRPTATSVPVSNTDNTSPCAARADWGFVYAVMPGDTLSSIASRAGTTFQTLADGNCLADANTIEVGQVLRVPNQILQAPAPTAQPETGDPQAEQYINNLCAGENRPDNANYVRVLPMLNFDNGCVTVAEMDTITISWPGAPQDVSEVIYLLRYPNTMNPIEVGRSTDPATEFSFTTMASFIPNPGLLYAWVEPVGENYHESDHLGFRVEATTRTPCGDILEPLDGPNGVVISPSTSYENGCYHVDGGTTLTISWQPQMQGVVGATFYRNNSRLPKPDVIGVDDDPGDGFWINWTVPATMPPSVFYVIPHGPDGSNSPVGVVVNP